MLLANRPTVQFRPRARGLFGLRGLGATGDHGPNCGTVDQVNWATSIGLTTPPTPSTPNLCNANAQLTQGPFFNNSPDNPGYWWVCSGPPIVGQIGMNNSNCSAKKTGNTMYPDPGSGGLLYDVNRCSNTNANQRVQYKSSIQPNAGFTNTNIVGDVTRTLDCGCPSQDLDASWNPSGVASCAPAQVPTATTCPVPSPACPAGTLPKCYSDGSILCEAAPASSSSGSSSSSGGSSTGSTSTGSNGGIISSTGSGSSSTGSSSTGSGTPGAASCSGVNLGSTCLPWWGVGLGALVLVLAMGKR